LIWPPEQPYCSVGKDVKKIEIGGIEIDLYRLKEIFKEV